MEEQLRLLQEQFEEGYISESVYNQRKQEIGNSTSIARRTPYEFKTREDYVNYMNESGYDKTTAGEDWDAYNEAIGQQEQQQVQGDDNLFGQFMPFFNPYGSNVQTDLYQLGSALGMPKGAQGRGLGVASSAAALGLGAGRTLMSGFANSRQTGRTQEEARRQMMQRSYRPQMQYGNTNYRGGTL